MYVSGLTDAMTPILGLSIHGGVPVTVVEYNRVGSGQINADTSRPRGQDETEDATVHVKTLHEHLALFDARRAVQAEVAVAVVVEEGLEDV